jgi:midasin
LTATLNILSSIRHENVARSFQQFLQEPLSQLCTQLDPKYLGVVWISLGRFAIDLYVPDRPIDPAAVRHCMFTYLDQQRCELSEEINLYDQLSLQDTVHPQNLVLTQLRDRLSTVTQDLSHSSNDTTPRGRDVRQIHSLWSEVKQFLDHTTSFNKVENIVKALLAGEPSARDREEITQESMGTFLHRLDKAHPSLSDLYTPLQWALLQMRMGLRLVAHASLDSEHRNPGYMHLLTALTTFPALHGCEMLVMQPVIGQKGPLSAFDLIVIDLSAVSSSTTTDEWPPNVHVAVETIYDQAVRLWNIDRAREEADEKEAHSLYRNRKLDHDSRTEAELEEAELRSLFPTFEDSHDLDIVDSVYKPKHVDSTHFVRLANLHLRLMQKKSSWRGFCELRASIMDQCLTDDAISLPSTFDEGSFALQMAHLQAREKLLAEGTDTPLKVFDFYRDPHPAEVQAAATILSKMGSRLAELIHEWPDQMVLQHLQQRCSSVQSLPLNSPIAKILTSVEQLLLQSEDWEVYANRYNSLQAHRAELIALIIRWRRLELSSWQQLLETQAHSFADEASEWWFRLYDACIRSPLSFDISENAGQQQLDTFLQDLIPLLREFISSSPLGQFRRRLDLLSSFELLVRKIQSRKSGNANQALVKVHQILHSMSSYYDQFSARIERNFSEQKSTLEKDIRDYIKLASWKDVNVQALKASAARTHHHLYKTIRKFRDIMRQPITAHLNSGTTNVSEERTDTFSQPVPFAILRDNIALDLAPSNMPTSVAKYQSLAETRVHVFIRQHQPHHIGYLTATIITSSKELSELSVPASMSQEKRIYQLKALIVRKRKAWSDLLKELRRIGLATVMKPHVLSQQCNERWLLEQPIIEAKGLSATKIQSYWNRLLGLLPEVRQTPAQHHEDISTRDVQRALSFVESCFSMVVESRAK